MNYKYITMFNQKGNEIYLTRYGSLVNEGFYVNEIDFGSAEINVETWQGSNQIGSQIVSRSVGQRDISLTGYICAIDYEDMKVKQRKLNEIIRPLESFSFSICQDEKDYIIDCSATNTIMYGVEYQDNNLFLCKFLIEAAAPYPVFRERENRKEIIYKDNETFSVENEGSLECGGVFTINIPYNGSSNVYSITIGTSSGDFHASGMLLYSGKIVIDSRSGKKDFYHLSPAEVKTSLWGKIDVENMVFPVLTTGMNEISFQCNYTAVSCEVEFSPEYLNIEGVGV